MSARNDLLGQTVTRLFTHCEDSPGSPLDGETFRSMGTGGQGRLGFYSSEMIMCNVWTEKWRADFTWLSRGRFPIQIRVRGQTLERDQAVASTC